MTSIDSSARSPTGDQGDPPSKAVESARPRNPYLWTVVGTLLGIGMLLIALRNVDLASLGATLRAMDLAWAGTVVISQLVFVALKSWRWGLLLRNVESVRFRHLQSAVYSGLAVNYVIAHLGEFLRAAFVARRGGVAVSTVLASVIVERVLDFIALLFLVAVAAAFATDLPGVFAAMSVVIIAVVVVATAGLYLLLNTPAWANRWVAIMVRPFSSRVVQWLGDQLARFRLGLTALRDLRLMLIAVLVSLVQWAVVVFLIWASCVAVGGVSSFMAATVTFLLVVLGQQLPNSPLQIGTTQVAFVIGLGLDDIAATLAVAASLVFTVFAMVPTMLVGGVCLLQARAGKIARLR